MPLSECSLPGSQDLSQQEFEINRRRLKARIDQVIRQLEQQYTFDRTAIKAKLALMELKGQLEEEKPINSLKLLNAVNEFIATKEHNEQRETLIYPFYIAFTQTFPGNRKKDGHWIAFKRLNEYEEERVQTPITKLNGQVIPTMDNLLHFTQFVIQEPSFSWQDKLSAVHCEIQQGTTFNRNIPLAEGLFIVGQKERQPEQGMSSTYLTQAYIAYYYYMIQQGTTKEHLLFWNKELQQDANLGTLIAMICEYKHLLQENTYYTEAGFNDTSIQLETLEDKIIEHPIAEQYLPINEEEASTFNVKIDRMLSNLTAPAIYHKKLKLSVALQLSDEERAQLQAEFTKKTTERNESNPLFFQYQKLMDSPDFAKLLAYTRQSGPEFFYTLCQLPQNEAQAIIQHLSVAGIISILNNVLALLDSSEDDTMVPKKIFNSSKLEKLVDTIRQSYHTLNPDLLQFIDAYNQEEPSEPIRLTNREKNKLQHLDTLSRNFDKILQENKLALNVLSQHGCHSLIEALEEYGELSNKLQRKRFKEILTLAENYCRNARENILLYAIELGLGPEKALSLDGNSRRNWIIWRNGLHDIIKTTYGGVEEREEDCDRYISQRIPSLLAQYDTTDRSIEKAMEDDKKYFDTLVFTGLFQCKVLSLDEIFSLSLEKIYYFSRINERLSDYQDKISKEANCNNPIEIIAESSELKKQRAALDALKHRAAENKEAKQSYLNALDEYIESLLVHTRIIGINLHSIYASFVDELAKIGLEGVELQQTLSIPQKQLAQLKQDRAEASSFFNKQLRVFKDANVSDFPELLKAIALARPPIQITQVYKQGLQVTKIYSRSKTIEEYYQAGLLEPRHIFTLTPEISKTLKQKIRYFLLIKSNHLKSVFKEVVQCNIQTNRADIREDFDTILPYLRLRLLSKLVELQAVSSKALVSAALENNHYSSQLETDWIKRLSHLQGEEQMIVGRVLKSKYNNSHTELLATVYQLDPRTHSEDFSFDHLIQSMEGYLSNLENGWCQLLLKVGGDLVAIMHLTQQAITQFSKAYEKLQPSLNTETLNTCIATVLDNDQSIEEMSGSLETAYSMLQSPLLNRTFIRSIQALSDNTKQIIYQSLVQLTMTNNKAPRVVAEAIQKLSSSMVKPLLQFNKFTVDEILANNLKDFEELENKLNEIFDKQEILSFLSKQHLYSDVRYLLVDACSSRIKSNHLISTLTAQLDRFINEEALRVLIAAGITPKNAFRLPPSTLDQTNEILSGLNQQLENGNNVAAEEVFRKRIDHLVDDLNHPSSHRHSRRNSRGSSQRRLSNSSHSEEPFYQTTRLISRESKRGNEKKVPTTRQAPSNIGFFSRLNKLGEKFSHSGKRRAYAP